MTDFTCVLINLPLKRCANVKWKEFLFKISMSLPHKTFLSAESMFQERCIPLIFSLREKHAVVIFKSHLIYYTSYFQFDRMRIFQFYLIRS